MSTGGTEGTEEGAEGTRGPSAAEVAEVMSQLQDARRACGDLVLDIESIGAGRPALKSLIALSFQRWTVADIKFSFSPQTWENLLHLHTHGCHIQEGINAFTLGEQLEDPSALKLVVVANVCSPAEYRDSLKMCGQLGIGYYNALVFSAIRASCPNAMIVMISRWCDNEYVAKHMAGVCRWRPCIVVGVGELPFAWRPKACNHTSEHECELADGSDLMAWISAGNNARLLEAVGNQLDLVRLVGIAASCKNHTLFLGEWDAALAVNLCRTLSGSMMEERLGDIEPGSNPLESRVWNSSRYTYQDYLDHVKQKRPYDTLECQGLFAAMMWMQATPCKNAD